MLGMRWKGPCLLLTREAFSGRQCGQLMQWKVDSVPPHLQGPPFWADRVTPVLGGVLGLVSQVYARRSRGMQAQSRPEPSQRLSRATEQDGNLICNQGVCK